MSIMPRQMAVVGDRFRWAQMLPHPRPILISQKTTTETSTVLSTENIPSSSRINDTDSMVFDVGSSAGPSTLNIDSDGLTGAAYQSLAAVDLARFHRHTNSQLQESTSRKQLASCVSVSCISALARQVTV
ncbi:hypothetical protein M405DRAFT_406481 [Rhizopogon salebrosus TDB-379]|nr:hypothetical protein M405DRAFT_406481 [Rhizopogon salebrosus TDB-379]